MYCPRTVWPGRPGGRAEDGTGGNSFLPVGSGSRVLSARGTHRGLLRAPGPLLLHRPPAVRAHPQWQVQHAVALGGRGKGQSACSLNPTL